MEIPYRNTKIQLKTIPKGTLLFRLVKNQKDDLRGVPLDDGTRCMIPNYNVFFYPNPFAVKKILGKYIDDENLGKTVYVYQLTQDIKVIHLLKPSKHYRELKGTKRNFIKRCSTVPKGCMPNSLASYDPCLSDTIVKKFPDVVGMMGIPARDSRELKRSLKKTSKKVSSYFKLASDSFGLTGIPELVLHPLTKRPSKQVIVHDDDILENNYKLLTKFNINDEQKMIQFMDRHTTYNPETFFYSYTE
jgi:hypothetical protein